MKKFPTIRSFLVVIVIILFANMFIFLEVKRYKYVRGEYSVWCYEKGEAHDNIKKQYHFKNLQDCGKPLYKK